MCFPYKALSREDLINTINIYSESGSSFLFFVNYKADSGYVIKTEDIDKDWIVFNFNGFSNLNTPSKTTTHLDWTISPIPFISYQQKFDYIVDEINKGNSFLANLTQPSIVSSNYSLLDIYSNSKAKYKLYIKDHFLVLSPEIFIRIKEGKISSYPMKGTIDASIDNAESIILNDNKEKAEHATIVDLIRNDLSMVADNVKVERYRYIDKIHTNKKDLLQVSSEIIGTLPADYRSQLGDIIFKLLPAGSITGAPKPKTMEIIEKAENYDRGFYTGICGYFDGENLDAAVMIRFIEQHDNHFLFKSGGGITSQSDVRSEYEELIQKVYVPFS